MGKTEINFKIGTDGFNSLKMASKSDINLCNNNCILVEEYSKNTFIEEFGLLLKNFDSSFEILSYPLKY
jgi:hypothetical protein